MYPKAGWKFVKCDQTYNIAGESDWKPIASNLKACGVQTAVWVGSPDPNMENLLNVARQVGYHAEGVGDRPERLHEAHSPSGTARTMGRATTCTCA